MNKKLIRLTESDLHRIVKESVGKVINEGLDTNKYSSVKQEIRQMCMELEGMDNRLFRLMSNNGLTRDNSDNVGTALSNALRALRTAVDYLKMF